MNQEEDKPIRLSRLNIFLFDFQQARRFAEYILVKKLHAVKGSQAKAKLVHLAFNTSMIVSYSRPFHKSNEGPGLPKVWLRQFVGGVLNDAEEKLHTKIINKRDKVFAHSDAEEHEFAGLSYSSSLVKFYKPAFEPLSKDETEKLKIMILKWIRHLDDERSELRGSNRRVHDARTSIF